MSDQPARGRQLVIGNLVTPLGVFLWATSFPTTALLLKNWHPVPLAATRMAIGGPVGWRPLNGHNSSQQ